MDREIYEQLRGRLMRFAASLVGPEEAADLVSEAILATLERRSLGSIENPQAYLMTAVLNRARSHWRRVARERRAAALQGVPSPVPDHAEAASSGVVATVAELPLQQRAAIYLVYWEGRTPQEAAALLGVRSGTLRRYLYLARRKLRRHLEL